MLMKVLITGGTGYLGSNLVKAFLREGHDVIVLKRSNSCTCRIKDVLADIFIYDIDECNLQTPFNEHSHIDAIVHTATCYGRGRETFCEIFQTNTFFPLQLLNLSISSNVPVFINTDTCLPRELNPYALSKKQFYDWGKYCASCEYSRFINIELQHFFGPGDDSNKFVTNVIQSLLRNRPEIKLTKGEQIRDFIYIDDVVEAYLMVLKNSIDNVFFADYPLGTGRPITIKKFVETVACMTGSKSLLKFGTVSYRKNELMESKADISRLIQLGWSPRVTLQDGLKMTIAAERTFLE